MNAVNQPHPFVIANQLVHGSYISLQMALGYYGLIPEHVAVVTSVTTGRPRKIETMLGRFTYRSIEPAFFLGIQQLQFSPVTSAHIATPEKALLDLIHLTPHGDQADYLRALRLQNLDQLDLDYLHELAVQLGTVKLDRAADLITLLAQQEQTMYVPL